MASRPSPARRGLAVAAGVVVALAAAEGLVRLAGVAPEISPVRRGRIQLSANPRLVFEPVPDMVVEGRAGLWDAYAGRSNSLGYRDREHARAKPAGTFRIAVLGDSVAAGWGIERHEDLFGARLEAALTRRGLPVEVLNFAVTGYNTAQEVETLAARGLAFAPDLVLLAYCLNDRRPPDPRLVAALREEAARPGAVAPAALAGVRRGLLASALYRLVWLRLGGGAGAALEMPPGVDPEAPPPRPDQVRERWVDGRPVAGPAAVEAAFARLAGLAGREAAAGRPFRVVVAVFPYLRQLFRDPYADHHAHVASLSRRHGFAHLDLTTALRACQAASPEPVALDRYHPSARGHACAAAAIERFLIARGLVPG